MRNLAWRRLSEAAPCASPCRLVLSGHQMLSGVLCSFGDCILSHHSEMKAIKEGRIYFAHNPRTLAVRHDWAGVAAGS